MKSHAKVVVIGGGVVGASVLYHLTKAGWKDVLLIERAELTSGSTWHAAGGMHTVNGDPNVAKLQQYTIELYKEIEQISGQSCGVHITGGIMLAGTRERLDWLKMAKARGRYLGMDLEIISVDEAAKLFPLMDKKHFVGAMYDPIEGHVDPYGVTHAYAKSAQIGGAEIVRHTRVTDLQAARRRLLGCDHRSRQCACRACGERRRPVGARGGPHGGHRAAHPGDGASIPDHRRHAGAGRQEGAAARHRLRRRNLHPPGARRHAHGHLRACRRALVGADDALGFRPGPAAERPGAHRAEPRGRIRAFPGARRRRHQEGGERAVHLCARRQSSGGADPRA